MRFGLAASAALLAGLSGCSSAAGGSVASAAEGMETAQWSQFYKRAGEVFQQGQRDEAVALFYIGQLRGRIRINCVPGRPDMNPAVFASLQETLGRTINEYAGGEPAAWADSIDQALTWDAAHPDPSAPGETCRMERDKQRQGLGELRRQILANAGDIRRQRTANGLPNR